MEGGAGSRSAPGPSATGAEPVRYIGLVTRVIAFVIDCAVIDLVATIVGVAWVLVIAALHLPSNLRLILGVIGAVAYVLWSMGYFVGLWSSTGQTIGARMMRFRVVAVERDRLKPRRSLVRCIGLFLAALPLFAGYLIILVDPKRRGLQDYLARTVVVDAPAMSIAQQRRAAQRVAAATSEVVEHSPNSGDDVLLALPQPCS
jgi:uncharacterized RDD family membrane protein YckC